MVSIVTSLGAVLLPRASYYIHNEQYDAFRRIGGIALNFVFLAAIPISIYFILFAEPGILFISDSAYAPGIPAMRIIMPTVMFIGLTNILGIQMLVPLGREKAVLYSEIAGAVTDVIINMLLIPKYKAAGAAAGTLIAEAVVFLVQYIAVKDEVTDLFRRIKYIKLIIAVMLASICSYWVLGTGLGNFMTLAVSAVIFFGVYAIVLLILKEEMMYQIFLQMKDKMQTVLKRH